MTDIPVPLRGQSRQSALDLLERARELAHRVVPAPTSFSKGECTVPGGGDKGDKWVKPPFSVDESSAVASFEFMQVVKDPEVAWRVQAMLRLISRSRPIPFLVARDVPPVSGTCLSCGDALAADQRYRCRLCVDAAILTLREAREILLTKHRNEQAK